MKVDKQGIATAFRCEQVDPKVLGSDSLGPLKFSDVSIACRCFHCLQQSKAVSPHGVTAGSVLRAERLCPCAGFPWFVLGPLQHCSRWEEVNNCFIHQAHN